MHPALIKIRHVPLDTFVQAKVAPQQPLVRQENMEIEPDKPLKLRHAHTHAPQAHTTACQAKLIFLLHVLLALQERIAMEMVPGSSVLLVGMEEQISQNKQTCLLRVHTFVRQESMDFSKEKYRLTMHAWTASKYHTPQRLLMILERLFCSALRTT